MPTLFDQTPENTESVKLGAQRIRDMKTLLNSTLGLLFSAANTPASGGVVEAMLATDAVTRQKIKNGEVIAGKLADDAVVAANIAGGAVVAGKLANNAVTEGIIANAAVTFANFGPTAKLRVPVAFGHVNGITNEFEGVGIDTVSKSGSDYVITYAAAFPDAQQFFFVTPHVTGTGVLCIATVVANSTTTFTVRTRSLSGNGADTTLGTPTLAPTLTDFYFAVFSNSLPV